MVSVLMRRALLLGAWLVAVELGVEGWYRWHERQLGPPVVWFVQLPREREGYHELPLSDKARQLLRYDEGVHAAWTDRGKTWQMIFLRWNPGRIAVHLAKSHTPATCLTASGHRVLPDGTERVLEVNGLQLPFMGYTVDEGPQSFHVFYCLWEDRAADGQGDLTPKSLTYESRLGTVRAGRRNLGQRSLEIAVSGFSNLAEAEAAVRLELGKALKKR